MAARIRTALHELLPSIRIPVISAPMAGAAGGLLAAEGTLSPSFLSDRADLLSQSPKQAD